MELLAVDSEERVEKVKQVWDRLEANNRDILNYLKDLDNNLEANEDAYSDLSDPFSDMGDSEFAKAANQKVILATNSREDRRKISPLPENDEIGVGSPLDVHSKTGADQGPKRDVK